MNKIGHADLPLHGGKVPYWLSKRMTDLARPIVEAIVMEYGVDEFIKRVSDPLWFQSFGCVLGMDWHSSGITTSVMGSLKAALNPISHELGIFVCGGRGKSSRKTPEELMRISDKTGLDGNYLVRCSKLTAKVDNTAIQDGFQLYLHSFILTRQGSWAVVQQGMNNKTNYARRYHWHSAHVRSFFDEPHASICGQNQGMILNLTDKNAKSTRTGTLNIVKESPYQIMKEIRKIRLPEHHDVKEQNVNLKRLGAILAFAHDQSPEDFESLLMLKGVGPRALQSLALMSEIVYGTPSRFQDPARFSFAHGGKDGHPFPVPTKIYDQSIATLKESINLAKLGQSDKIRAFKTIHTLIRNAEKGFTPNKNFSQVIQKEKKLSYQCGGRTVKGRSKPPKQLQLDLFQN